MRQCVRMKTALPSAVRLHLKPQNEAKMLKLMNKAGLEAPWLTSHFLDAVLDVLPDTDGEISLPVRVKLANAAKAQAA
jgi:hypothetical protein